MKLSQQTKEIINIVIFLVVAALLIISFVTYPLGRVTDQFGRADLDDFNNEDTIIVNDPSTWVDSGFVVDTFKVESDGLTTLASLKIAPDSLWANSISGTVILIHDEQSNRDVFLQTARLFSDNGFMVLVYDQRASGLSTGRYHGEGQLEATDLLSLIAFANLRGWIHPPLSVIGFGLGAEAALLASLEDKRIEYIIASNPFLSTHRMFDILKDRHDTYWLPFYRTIMSWWYEIRSGNAPEYRDIESIQPAAVRTLLLIDDKDDHIEAFIGKSDSDLLTVGTPTKDPAELLFLLQSMIPAPVSPTE